MLRVQFKRELNVAPEQVSLVIRKSEEFNPVMDTPPGPELMVRLEVP